MSSAISRGDADCRGVLVLGQTSGWDGLVEAFRACADVPVVKGFAVGRTIFSDPVMRWFADELGDAALVDEVAERYRAVVSAWDAARSHSGSAEAIQV